MARTRFTIIKLRNGIERINGWLADAGALVRFEVSGRNGYQAVDEYPVDADGNRIGTGVNRMVGSGTSRETHDAAYTAYSHIVADLKLKHRAKLAEALQDILDGQSVSDLHHMTGLSMDRCAEIFRIAR